jgi:hypothetical protein
MEIPYQAIAIWISVGAMAVAFYKGGDNARIVILGLAILSFSFPILFPTSTVRLISFIVKCLIGLGCLIYLKWLSAQS